MTHNDKIARVKILINDSTLADEVIETYLDLAETKIKNTLSPFREIECIPSRYDLIHCELTSRYIFRRGLEGQVSSNENGIVRTFDSPDDKDLLSVVTPYVGY